MTTDQDKTQQAVALWNKHACACSDGQGFDAAITAMLSDHEQQVIQRLVDASGVMPKVSLWHDPETGNWKKLTKPDRPTYEPYCSEPEVREVIASLQARLERARQQVECGRQIWREDQERIKELFAQLEQSEARVRELEKDAARYRWLRDEADYLRLKEGSPQVCLTNEWGEIISTGKEAYPQGEKLDSAIDAAMKKEGGA